MRKHLDSNFGFGPAEQRNADALIEMAFAEDLGGGGDLTAEATIPANGFGSARFVARTPGVIAGLPVLYLVAVRFGLAGWYRVLASDGDLVEPGRVLAEVSGPMRQVLMMERTALNFLQRLSGVATLTRRYVVAALEAETGAKILDTRKTTPGWRLLEKYAVRCGGGTNHRIGLYDGVLIKDNHLAWLSREPDPIGRALASARDRSPAGTVVEIEVDSLDQLDRALACGPDIILVDNFPLDDMAEAVRRRDLVAPSVRLEASGGINLDTVAAIALTGVDRISVGALTHSAPALDIALDYDTGFLQEPDPE